MGGNEPEIVNEMQEMDMDHGEDDVDGENDDDEGEDESEVNAGHEQQVNIDGQGEHRIVDEDGSEE